MKRISLKNSMLLLIVVGISLLPASSKDSSTFKPKEGFVPDETTAIAIAEAVLRPIYGAEVDLERPYHAKLINGVWWVGGTLPHGRVGGVAVIRIAKKDACVLSVVHGE